MTEARKGATCSVVSIEIAAPFMTVLDSHETDVAVGSLSMIDWDKLACLKMDQRLRRAFLSRGKTQGVMDLCRI